jgi:hypothetical protein
MDGKRISIVIVLALELGLETLHAAMPFGRLMLLHYGPDDIRTVIVPRTKNPPLHPSSSSNAGVTSS